LWLALARGLSERVPLARRKFATLLFEKLVVEFINLFFNRCGSFDDAGDEGGISSHCEPE